MGKEKKPKTTKNQEQEQQEEENPHAKERKKLKNLAVTNQILSITPADGFTPLIPSKTIIKHHGSDIIKKSQRKNRYLFSFNGLLAPISGGKIGELANLASKNPILYFDFPQGRMKLLGTIVYPKNRYLSLQFSKGGKSVTCEDCFDNMIVFSDAYWIGSKDENPDEARLEFPEELYEREQSELDFKGGAGASVMQNKIADKVAATIPMMQNVTAKKVVATSSVEEEPLSDSPIDDTETQSPERQDNAEDLEYTTPVRHSERTAGKRFNFAEVSSGDNSAGSASDMAAEPLDEAVDVLPEIGLGHGIPDTAVDAADFNDIEQSTLQAPMSSSLSSVKTKSSRSCLVQATISTLFKKVEQKRTEDDVMMVPNTASNKITQPSSSKAKNKRMQLVPEVDGPTKEKNTFDDSRAGATNMKKKRRAEAAEVEDDIVEFSSVSEETNKSDD